MNQPAFPDGPPPWPAPNDAVAAALQQAAADGTWGKYHGGHCEQLREDLRSWAKCESVELCASGTAASELALRALRVTSGDEVVLGAYDYAASFKNVLMLGATPVLIDVDPATFSVRLDQLADAITDKTKAIVVSHLHGGVTDMAAVMDIANAHGISVLEDACQATGATIGGRRTGTFGTLGIISFGGSKLITAGRGGAILGNDEQLFQRMHLHSFRGNTAYPLSELQAAVLVPQLAALKENNQHRADRVNELRTLLDPCEQLTLIENQAADSVSAWYKVGMLWNGSGSFSRDQFSEAARTHGIACDRSLHALHTVHSKRRFRTVGELNGASQINDCGLQLHHPVLLGTQEDMAKIAGAFDGILKSSTG